MAAEKGKFEFGGADGNKLRNKVFKVIFIRYKDKETGNQKVLGISAKTGGILFAFRADKDNIKMSTTLPEFMVESRDSKKEVVEA